MLPYQENELQTGKPVQGALLKILRIFRGGLLLAGGAGGY